jgi:hypothetical protein
VGVNVTLVVHFCLAARLVPHVVAETAKSPVVEIAMLVSATLWLFAKVNVLGMLLVPIFCFPYTALDGVSVAGSMPVPNSGTVWGLLRASSVKLSVPVISPNFGGAKVTLTLHDLPSANWAPQVFAEIPKLALTVMLLMLSVTEPVLVAVTFLTALVVLT